MVGELVQLTCINNNVCAKNEHNLYLELLNFRIWNETYKEPCWMKYYLYFLKEQISIRFETLLWKRFMYLFILDRLLSSDFLWLDSYMYIYIYIHILSIKYIRSIFFLYITWIVDNPQKKYVLAKCTDVLISFFSFLCDYNPQRSKIKRCIFIRKCISKNASEETPIQRTSKIVCVCVFVCVFVCVCVYVCTGFDFSKKCISYAIF